MLERSGLNQPFARRWLDTQSGSQVAAKKVTELLHQDKVEYEAAALQRANRLEIPRVVQLVEIVRKAADQKFDGTYVVSECASGAAAGAVVCSLQSTIYRSAQLLCFFCRFVQGISLDKYIAWRKQHAFTAAIENKMLTTAVQLLHVRCWLSARCA